jgi:hypothetical protein
MFGYHAAELTEENLEQLKVLSEPQHSDSNT